MNDVIPVICKSIRKQIPNQISVGQKYLIYKQTIWIDRDGDVYGEIHDLDGKRIGDMLLSHFRGE